MSCLRYMLACLFAVSSIVGSSVDAAPKRRPVKAAVRGKHHPLHKAHGPHLILVTTLRDVDFALKSEGMSAKQAADEIVYQLRLKRIPAYVYHQKQQRSNEGRFIARQEGIAILAGNFESPDHRHAQVVLDFVQKFQPEFLRQQKNGAIIAAKDAAQPFKRAFIIANPLRSAEEMRSKTVDKDLVKLNADSGEVSLLKNRGTYSVKVATFSGSAVVQVNGRESKEALDLFRETLGKNLDESGQMAWELATALRDASRYGYGRDYDSWVLHNRHKSYVTVGSFDSPDDPRIKQLVEEFRAKDKPNPKTGRTKVTPELFSIPKNPVGQALPDKLWFFDETPRVVKIPGR
ncbi:MAG: hypothetical protein ABGZ35_31225 [Planctomycetaceae bacterium]